MSAWQPEALYELRRKWVRDRVHYGHVGEKEGGCGQENLRPARMERWTRWRNCRGTSNRFHLGSNKGTRTPKPWWIKTTILSWLVTQCLGLLFPARQLSRITWRAWKTKNTESYADWIRNLGHGAQESGLEQATFGVHGPEPCYSKRGPWTSTSNITCELLGNADSRPCQIRIAQVISLSPFPLEGPWSAAFFSYYTFTFPGKKKNRSSWYRVFIRCSAHPKRESWVCSQ